LHERPASREKYHGWIWVVVLLAAVLVAVGIFISRHHTTSASASPSTHGGRGGMGAGPIMVSTTVAQTGDIGIYVTALGMVTPVNTVAITSRVQGQIMKVYYQEGQMVKAGDPLIDIDPGPDQAALLVAKGQLARDTAMLEDSKLDLERYQEAFASNAIPKQQLDTQTATVHQNEGTVELDQGNLDSAQVQLAYCHITAPISGRVGLRLVDAGNVVQAGSTNLVMITQLAPITVVFTVAEDYLPQIQKQLAAGNELDVDVFDRAQVNKLASGTLQTLDNQIDPTTGTLRFKAIFTNEDNALFPNQFVNARLLVDTLEDVTLLPNTAIQRNSDTAFVYLLQADQTGTNQTSTNQTATVKMQTITAGTTDGTVTEVEGIEPGTKVVADNFNKLSDGAKVIIRPANGAGHQKRKNTSQ
jgi:multidrug efflux system membrane fusion protein